MKRQSQLRLNSNITVLLLILLFILCAWLSNRYYFETDMTRTGRHTLSRASVEILAQANKPLEVSAYARHDPELRALIKKYIGRFQRHKTDITLYFVNPDAFPDEVRQLGINVNGELVLRYDGRIEHVKTNSEQEFVNALQRLLRGDERWLAFLDGHGERNPNSESSHDLAQWTTQLNLRGFKFRPLNLLQTGVIPDNTSVLVIASPVVALLPGELAIITEYLDKGGNMLWLREPDEKTGMHTVAEMLGISMPPGVVIDSATQILGIKDPTIALTTTQLYGHHPVTDKFELTTFFPKAGAIMAGDQQGWLMRSLLSSGNHTWLELGELQGEIGFDPGEQLGSVTLGVSLERKTDNVDRQQQRILVIGDGDFLSNNYVNYGGNMELGLRMINWLSNDDKLVVIPTNVVEDSELNLSTLTLGALGLIVLIILPLIFLAAGIFTWWRRKRL